jgi:pyruvate formate lyase activating enzyme
MEHNLPVKGLIETSFLDWKGSLSSVLFLGGCNFRCPFCHNQDLVLNDVTMEDMPMEYIMGILRKYKDWIDKVVVTGGEPTIHRNLYRFIDFLKSEGFQVKLDTNGSNPEVLRGLVGNGLVDYVAMDVKGPIDRYSRWCGVEVDSGKIRESIGFLLDDDVDYEFRMTLVPFLHREDDVYEVASFLKGARRFYVQGFRPVSTLNPAFTRIRPYVPEKLESIRSKVAQIMTVENRMTSSAMTEEGTCPHAGL